MLLLHTDTEKQNTVREHCPPTNKKIQFMDIIVGNVHKLYIFVKAK